MTTQNTSNKTFGKAFINVAGTSFANRQGALQNLRKHDEGAYITLRREKANTEDANAIKVIAHTKNANGTWTHACVGYVPAKTALWLAPKMDAGLTIRCVRRHDAEKKPMKFVVGSGRGDYKLGCAFTILHEINKIAAPAEAVAVAVDAE